MTFLFFSFKIENQLTTLIEKLASGNQTNDHSFIPVSLSYEFIPKTFGTIKNLSSKKNLVSLKPIARINFGYSHSLKVQIITVLIGNLI